ncbi:MAG: hypothetical protein ACP5SH_02310 [Syntrophobacteraceae bacterium]
MTLQIICGTQIRVHGRLLRIARLEADSFQFIENPPEMIDALRKCRTRVDIFTFLQRLPDTSVKYDYPVEWDNFAVLPVSTFDHWWNEQIGFKARNKAKQAEKKGVVVREVVFDTDLVRGIWEVYNECPVRQGRAFAHYGKDMETVYREEATFLDSSIFIGAFFEDRLIGFVKLVHDETRTQAGLMNIVSMIGHRDKAPTNALIAQAVKSCAVRGIPYLVYSNFCYGRKQQDGIVEFKERNAFERFDSPRYYAPLTSLGRVAFRLGLHRTLADHLPEPVLAKFRELRNDWYNKSRK